MADDDIMVKVLVRVHRDGTVDYCTARKLDEVPDRMGRLLATAALGAAKHAIQEEGLRNALEDGRG